MLGRKKQTGQTGKDAQTGKTHKKRGLLNLGAGNQAKMRADAIALEMAQAQIVFEQLIALEAAYDARLGELYADDGVVIERTLDQGVVRRTREIPVPRYRAALEASLAFSKKARERSFHTQILADHQGPGWVTVRSMRRSSQARQPAPYEVTLRREPDGNWRIARETATLLL